MLWFNYQKKQWWKSTIQSIFLFHLKVKMNFLISSQDNVQMNLEWYFKLSNNRAANLILFWKKSTLHVLIPSCTFIYFEGFAILHVYSILHDYLFHKFQFTTYFTKFFEEFQIFAENKPNEYLELSETVLFVIFTVISWSSYCSQNPINFISSQYMIFQLL